MGESSRFPPQSSQTFVAKSWRETFGMFETNVILCICFVWILANVFYIKTLTKGVWVINRSKLVYSGWEELLGWMIDGSRLGEDDRDGDLQQRQPAHIPATLSPGELSSVLFNHPLSQHSWHASLVSWEQALLAAILIWSSPLGFRTSPIQVCKPFLTCDAENIRHNVSEVLFSVHFVDILINIPIIWGCCGTRGGSTVGLSLQPRASGTVLCSSLS